MRRLISYCIILAILFFLPVSVLAQSEKTFITKYSTIHYSEDKDLDDFIWRLGGQRIDFSIDKTLASNRVDRIVDRVKAILDMQPDKFKIDIYLHRGPLDKNKVAYYEHRNKSIYISVDYTTDGVLAHEVAHAIISQYFTPPPPSKIQEILTQYVDRYLWSDY